MMENKKKRNWNTISLWVVSIGLIGAVSLLYVGMNKIFKVSAKKYEVESLKNNVSALKNPNRLSFSADGLQIVNDKIIISINKVEKYLSGYKMEVGVLNSSTLTLNNIELSILKKGEYFNNEVAKISVNKKLPSGYMANVSATIENITEEQLSKDIFYIKYVNSIYHYNMIK